MILLAGEVSHTRIVPNLISISLHLQSILGIKVSQAVLDYFGTIQVPLIHYTSLICGPQTLCSESPQHF